MLACIVPGAVNGSLSLQQASALLMAQAIPAGEKAPFRSNTLLSGRNAAGSNEKEIKDYMKSADAATREAYERQVSASSLAGPVKQDLLRYC